MCNAHSAEYIQIYESIVIEFFLRLKMHKTGKCVLRFDIKNAIALSAWSTTEHAVSWLNLYILPDLASINNSRFVDPNLRFDNRLISEVYFNTQ